MALALSHLDLLCVSFNQDGGCFAVGTDKGFRIYNCDPFKLTYQREFKSGGLGIVEMLFRCNLMALVGGGKQPRFPPSKMILWDDHQKKAIGELTFRTEVKAVRLRKDCIVVVLLNKVYVYSMTDLQILHQYETAENERGIIAVTSSPDNMVLACPASLKGHVQFEVYRRKLHRSIRAVESNLACIALNHDGTMLATASEKGTLIRVFSTETNEQTHEVRRGWDRAVIFSIAFSLPTEHGPSQWVSVSSDKGTVHIYSLAKSTGISKETEEDTPPPAPTGNPRSSLSFIAGLGILPSYFASERSFAQFKVPEMKAICSFCSTDDTVLYVLGSTGVYWKVRFDPIKGGECSVENHADFNTRSDSHQGNPL